MRHAWWMWMLAAALAGAGCSGAVPPASPTATTATATATKPRTSKPPATPYGPLPPRALLGLEKLQPPATRPSSAADADRVPEQAQEPLTAAEKYLAAGDASRAIPLLERAKGFAPKSPRILRNLGLAYAALGDHGRAETNLRQSLGGGGDDLRTHALLGQYAQSARQFDQALTHYRTALTCTQAKDDNPQTAEALLRLADLLEQQGLWTAALDAHCRLGELLSQHAQAYAGVPLLRSRLEHPEQNLIDQGQLLVKLRRSKEAAAMLEQAYRWNKGNPQAGPLAVEALVNLGELERGERIVNEMMLDPQAQTAALEPVIRRLARARKEPGLPQRMLTAYIARGGRDWQFIVAMAELLVDLGSPAEGLRVIAAHRDRMPQDNAVNLRLAELYIRAGGHDLAASRLTELLGGSAAPADVYALVSRMAPRLPAGVELKVESAPPAVAAVLAGMLQRARGNKGEAVKLFEQAIEKDHQCWAAYEMLEEMHAAAGDTPALGELTRRIAEAGGDSHMRFYLIGKSQFDRGLYRDAEGNLRQARSRSSSHVPTLLLMAQTFLRLSEAGGDADHAPADMQAEAERCLLSAYGLSPNNEAVARALFDLYESRRRRTDAARLAEQFARDNPLSFTGRLLRVRALLLRGQTQDAHALLPSLLAEAPNNAELLLLNLGLTLPDRLDMPLPPELAAKALAGLEAVLKAEPKNQSARLLQAAVLTNQGRHAEAARGMGTLYQEQPANAALAQGYLTELARAGQKDKALAEVDAIAARKDLALPMRRALLAALADMERHDQAQRLLEKWLASPLDKQDQQVLRAAGVAMYAAARDYDAADKLLDQWMQSESDPDRLNRLRIMRLGLLVQARKVDRAVQYAEECVKADPVDIRPKYTLLELLVEQKQAAKALELVDAWLGDASDPLALIRLRLKRLDVLGALGRLDEVYDIGHKGGLDHEDTELDRMHALRVLLDYERFDQALKLAEEELDWAQKLGENDARRPDAIETARRHVVSALIAAEKHDPALQRIAEWAKGLPAEPKLLRLEALVLNAKGSDEQYLQVQERIYALDPEDEGINNDLGYSLADRGVQLERAETMIRHALSVEPDQVAYQDSLGWVLYKQGRLGEARRIFDQVVEADEETLHAVILDHAGDVYWRLGLKEQAQRHWQRAIDFGQKEKRKDRETKKVLAEAPKKLADAKGGKEPGVAPLGRGVERRAP